MLEGTAVWDQIKDIYPDMTESEKKIADYLMMNMTDAIELTITDLAQAIETSAGTITRFCKKIGVGSYSALKLTMQKTLTETNLPQTPLTLEPMQRSYIELIQTTAYLIDQDELFAICEHITNCRSIHLYGLGNAGLVAQEMEYRLRRMGLLATTAFDSHSMVMDASVVTKDDLVIAFSNSGESREVVQAVQLAQDVGCTTVAFVGYQHSPLAELVDYRLLTAGASGEAFLINTQLPLLFTADAVTKTLMETNDHLKAHYMKTLKALDQLKERSDS